MKIQLKCEKLGPEIIDDFVKQCKEKNLDVLPDSCKILVTNIKGQEIEITSDKLKVTYSNE